MKLLNLLFVFLFSTTSFAASNDSQKLFNALKLGNVEQTMQLLDAGIDPNSRNSDGQTALMVATFFTGHQQEPTILDLTKTLISHGAYVNADTLGWTALNMAANRGYNTVVNYLVANGANVNASDRICNRSVLWLTAGAGQDSTVLELLKYSVDINMRSCDGYTPLGIAKAQGFQSTVEILRNHGGVE